MPPIGSIGDGVGYSGLLGSGGMALKGMEARRGAQWVELCGGFHPLGRFGDGVRSAFRRVFRPGAGGFWVVIDDPKYSYVTTRLG